ncbi:SDR family NAD(P)-dependent oxidoreductase [uncultured Jatrophihabitans sp.]|uniref:SDR family NAD(P)-dependent oxidoreductase n=1 Tax=uncultured Jatrophihabitans sp. TaxID=1610747 RepID=UPI0035CABF14
MSDRVVVVAGASSGIGLATALRLAGDGARLVLSARRSGALDAAADACRSAGAADVRCVPGDLLLQDDVERLLAETLAAHGRVDAVVHTATVMAYGTIEAVPEDVFRTVVDTAIHGTANVGRVFVPQFRTQGYGTLVIVNSLLGSVTVPNMGAYATAKWGQRAVARTLQQELQHQRKIHVCIVSPGSTNTPIYRQAANYTGKAARPPVPVLQPERTATSIVGLLDHPRKHVSVPVGPTNPVIVSGFRLLPFVYDAMVGPAFKLVALTRTKEAPNTGNVHDPVAGKERLHGLWPDT